MPGVPGLQQILIGPDFARSHSCLSLGPRGGPSRMLRIIAHAALLAGALALGACGFADSRAPVPEFMRMKETEQPPPEPPPDVKRVVREQIDVVFVNTSYPREVHVAPPHREVRGPGWTACVRAQLTSATGSALGAQTYIVTISGGKVVDRRRAEADDICGTETYEPI
ncbi:blr5768 [Bradyrhizobium diazoefficiens USDA 110]|uniref:Blr5768 protein n=2 Tax=Bradyrhizobium diazoefficiens TaxID=1355477 RepID=Q89I71_BRADU|nr:hypothetical protein Bdiaspc4_30465 [Bradyrhizobium diazoefficiens]BAC51033.1 blr5768 [Bradyrhizobium diazoefficiens USDA 110]